MNAKLADVFERRWLEIVMLLSMLIIAPFLSSHITYSTSNQTITLTQHLPRFAGGNVTYNCTQLLQANSTDATLNYAVEPTTPTQICASLEAARPRTLNVDVYVAEFALAGGIICLMLMRIAKEFAVKKPKVKS